MRVDVRFSCWLSFATASAAVVYACGGGTTPATDGADASTLTVSPDASLEDTGSPLPVDAAADVASYPASCAGLCAKASAKPQSGCSSDCEKKCRALLVDRAPACASESEAFLACAVQNATVLGCGPEGVPRIQGCDAALKAYLACASPATTDGGTCPPLCKFDSDCQTCPQHAGRAACCDTTSGICYESFNPVCPAPSDGGLPPSY